MAHAALEERAQDRLRLTGEEADAMIGGVERGDGQIGEGVGGEQLRHREAHPLRRDLGHELARRGVGDDQPLVDDTMRRASSSASLR